MNLGSSITASAYPKTAARAARQVRNAHAHLAGGNAVRPPGHVAPPAGKRRYGLLIMIAVTATYRYFANVGLPLGTEQFSA